MSGGVHFPSAHRRAVASIVVLAFTCLLGLPAAEARPLVTGIAGLESRDATVFANVKTTGSSLVQIVIPWGMVAPDDLPGAWNPEDPADPNYRWGGIDLSLTRAVQAGLVPVALIDGAPRWAQRCHEADGRLCDPSPQDLASFATAAARRYGGTFQGLPRIQYWQGLNEPNLSLFFNPQFEGANPVSADLYRALINSFYAAIKSVDPSNLVIAAGLGPIAVPRYTIGPKRFTRELLCMEGRRDPKPAKKKCTASFDIFDIHPYTTGGPLHEGRADDVQLGDLEELQDLLRAADRAGRIKGKFGPGSTWITEFSWDSKPPDPGGLQMSILTRWTAMALYQSWTAGISHFFWYGIRDSANDGRAFDQTVESGLYFRGETIEQDHPKPMLEAFRFPFVALPQEDGTISLWGRSPTGEAGGVSIEARSSGRWRKVVRLHAAGSGIFKGKLDAGSARSLKGPFRATFRKETSSAFSLKEVRDFYQPPFG